VIDQLPKVQAASDHFPLLSEVEFG